MAAIPPIEVPVQSVVPKLVDALRLAMGAEEIGAATIDRVINRLLVGDPEGADAVRVLDEVRPPKITVHFNPPPPMSPGLVESIAQAIRRRGGPGGMAMRV